jgi:hypothetical protein
MDASSFIKALWLGFALSAAGASAMALVWAVLRIARPDDPLVRRLVGYTKTFSLSAGGFVTLAVMATAIIWPTREAAATGATPNEVSPGIKTLPHIVYVFTDPETKCEYFTLGSNTPLVPRTDRSGKHLCR